MVRFALGKQRNPPVVHQSHFQSQHRMKSAQRCGTTPSLNSRSVAEFLPFPRPMENTNAAITAEATALFRKRKCLHQHMSPFQTSSR